MRHSTVSVGLLSILITFFYFSTSPMYYFSVIKAKPLTVCQEVESAFQWLCAAQLTTDMVACARAGGSKLLL